MTDTPRVSFLGPVFVGKQKSFTRGFGLAAACGVLRESQLRPAVSETLGKLIHLDEKEQIISWWQSSNCLHLADTGCTK